MKNKKRIQNMKKGREKEIIQLPDVEKIKSEIKPNYLFYVVLIVSIILMAMALLERNRVMALIASVGFILLVIKIVFDSE